MSHVMFLIAMNMWLVSTKIITINYTRLGTSPLVWRRIRPIATRIDRDGDGALTWKDLELLLSKVLGNRIGKWVTNFLQKTGFDQDGDGEFTSKDLLLILSGNQHGAFGLKLGALAGTLIGAFAPLLPFKKVCAWSLRVVQKTAVAGKHVIGNAYEGLKNAWCRCWV